MIIFKQITSLIKDIKDYFYDKKATRELASINFFEDEGTHSHLPNNAKHEIYKLNTVKADQVNDEADQVNDETDQANVKADQVNAEADQVNND